VGSDLSLTLISECLTTKLGILPRESHKSQKREGSGLETSFDNWQAVREAIITYRGETIRIISARRSRDVEIAVYES